MSLLSQTAASSAPPLLAGGRPLSGWRWSKKSALKFNHPIPPLFSSRRPPNLCPSTPKQKSAIFVVNPDAQNDADFSQETVPLEGVIQFEKPSSGFSTKLNKWGRVALLAGGDVLALLLFSAIGRFSHGLSVVDPDTFRTADPFIAGWFLSAYFLGGYGEDGRGTNGLTQAVIAAAKSWGLGIPLGIIIRAASTGHIPPIHFVLVTMGSTSVLLIGWRTLLLSIFPNDKRKKSDVYKRGSPFELFEVWLKVLRQCPKYVMCITFDEDIKQLNRVACNISHRLLAEFVNVLQGLNYHI